MSIIRYITLSLLCITLMTSCDEYGKHLYYNNQSMHECHLATGVDSLGLKNGLIGTWKWKYAQCYYQEGSNWPQGDLRLEFVDHDTVRVTMNGTFQQKSLWSLKQSYPNMYELDLRPGITGAYGIIHYCDKMVSFNAAYKDVCDNYFIRESY